MKRDDSTKEAEALVSALIAEGLTKEQKGMARELLALFEELQSRLSCIEQAAGLEPATLAKQAANYALAMRLHGATLRGPRGADLLESLSGALLYARTEHKREIRTAADAMFALGVTSMRQLADKIGVTSLKVSPKDELTPYYLRLVHSHLPSKTEAA